MHYCLQPIKKFGIGANTGGRWNTLHFILANSFTYWGQQCSNYSDNYCLSGYQSRDVYYNRKPQSKDGYFFDTLIRPVHRMVNWFSFFNGTANTGSTCCEQQVLTYLRWGQKFGLSPLRYFKKSTDFRDQSQYPSRTLNRIDSVFDGMLCMNVITSVSFGSGHLVIHGRTVPSMDFILPPRPGETSINRYTYAVLQSNLTFDWFKNNYICKDHPNFCISRNRAH
ncbi:uncharacterized protein LOC142350423 isoform X2 [Convolutriloba macropyga]|uniref:uncharacterized protein LOC142350423 isoform X2 n=1 Tax=Convolutriloba macropyga TaxID=536237 RepID=UPI003F51CD75